MKPKVAAKASPAAVAMLRQATALAPKRLKASDGLLPSAAHLAASPDSDHNTGLAVDLTHDPKNGIDCNVIYEKIKGDDRVVYVIFNGRIWSKARASEGDRKYTGSNRHTKHLHVSINPACANDTSPWFKWMKQPSKLKKATAALSKKPKKKETPSPKED